MFVEKFNHIPLHPLIKINTKSSFKELQQSNHPFIRGIDESNRVFLLFSLQSMDLSSIPPVDIKISFVGKQFHSSNQAFNQMHFIHLLINKSVYGEFQTISHDKSVWIHECDHKYGSLQREFIGDRVAEFMLDPSALSKCARMTQRDYKMRTDELFESALYFLPREFTENLLKTPLIPGKMDRNKEKTKDKILKLLKKAKQRFIRGIDFENNAFIAFSLTSFERKRFRHREQTEHELVILVYFNGTGFHCQNQKFAKEHFLDLLKNNNVRGAFCEEAHDNYRWIHTHDQQAMFERSNRIRYAMISCLTAIVFIFQFSSVYSGQEGKSYATFSFLMSGFGGMLFGMFGGLAVGLQIERNVVLPSLLAGIGGLSGCFGFGHLALHSPVWNALLSAIFCGYVSACWLWRSWSDLSDFFC